MELQNDERYVDYACHPHSHVESDIFSYDAVSSTCTRNVITQKNWYLPSVFTEAQSTYGEGDELDDAIVNE